MVLPNRTPPFGDERPQIPEHRGLVFHRAREAVEDAVEGDRVELRVAEVEWVEHVCADHPR
jgi:hypothetical protein